MKWKTYSLDLYSSTAPSPREKEMEDEVGIRKRELAPVLPTPIFIGAKKGELRLKNHNAELMK